MNGMTGILKKKGRHAMQGYKDREFVIDKGIFRYGPPGMNSKWTKKIKLADIDSIEPEICSELRHGFTIKKKDGRTYFFEAQNDLDKWKWINGFREAVHINTSPEWSPTKEVNVYNGRQVFIPLQKLSKVTMTGIWRWRYFYIDNEKVTYYSDPTLSQQLGTFMINKITKLNFIKNKHGKEIFLDVQVKLPEKRSYFFANPNEQVLQEFYDLLVSKPKNPKKEKFFV